MAASVTRQRPNILVSGTPGVGKSTLCEALVEKLGILMKCFSITLRFILNIFLIIARYKSFTAGSQGNIGWKQ